MDNFGKLKIRKRAVLAAILLLAAVLLLSACSSPADTQAFNRAAQTDTIQSYADFLKQYPDSPKADTARTEIDFILKTHLTEKDVVQRYLDNFPDGDLADQARAALAALSPTP